MTDRSGRHIRARVPSSVAGFSIGVLHLESTHPLEPGNVQNALSFRFPVLYEPVRGITFDQLKCGDQAGDAPILDAIGRLEVQGVSVIVGACGSFAHWQKLAVRHSHVPVFTSIMTQVPFVLAGLPAAQRLGVVFATATAFTERVKEQCDIREPERLVVLQAVDVPAFLALLGDEPVLDHAALEKGLVQLLVEAQEREGDIGAWLFQCSELPPYAAAVQEATGLPVFDMCTLIEHLYTSACRSRYGPAITARRPDRPSHQRRSQ